MSAGVEMSGLELVGRGRTSEVYAVDDTTVVKLLLPGFDPEMLATEARLTAAAHAAGTPAPAVRGEVEVDGRPGVLLERVRGSVVIDHLRRRPLSLGRLARLTADVHRSVHQARSRDLPPYVERLAAKIESAAPLPLPLRRRALDALSRLDSAEDRVLHGDFHPGNVVLTSAGPVLIDWLDAGRGSPAADVARARWLTSSATLPRDTPLRALVARMADGFGRRYLDHYLATADVDRAAVTAWRLPVLAARLAEGIAHEEAPLLAAVAAASG